MVEYLIGAPKDRVNSPTTVEFQVLAPERGAQLLEKPAGLGSTGPGQGAGVTEVEVLGHDLCAGRKDAACLGALAGTGCLRFLHILGRDSTDEGELQIAHRLPSTATRSGSGQGLRRNPRRRPCQPAFLLSQPSSGWLSGEPSRPRSLAGSLGPPHRAARSRPGVA
jgi:hypothetical protein